MSARDGITQIHRKPCRSRDGGRCNCSPSYRAEAYDQRAGKRHYKTFPTRSEAKVWRADAQSEIGTGVRAAPNSTTLRQAAAEWLAGVRDGSIRNSSGRRYKPSALASYEASLRQRVVPELGAHKLSDIRRQDVQRFADRLLAQGLDPQTVRNHLMPLRAIFRRALVYSGDVAVNPTKGLALPASDGRRERIASPQEAERLLAALPWPDRVIWATAIYSGLRAGELQALTWDCVDLATGIIRVERAWDPKSKIYVDPKSRAGRRRVPILDD